MPGPRLVVYLAFGFGLALTGSASNAVAAGQPAAGALALDGSAVLEPDGGDSAVTLVGLTGLTWDDVSAENTPHLWDLAGLDGAGVGNLLVRSVTAGSCPVDGWLALGSGRRAAERAGSITSDLAGVPSDCRSVDEFEVTEGHIAAWSDLLEVNTGPAGQELGALAQWLEQMNLTAAAVGPGAGIALANHAGQVANYRPAPDDPAALATATTKSLMDQADLILVDIGSRAAGLTPAQLDARIGAVLAATDGPVIVASLADYQHPDMGLLVVRGLAAAGTKAPATGLHLVGSSTTRRPDLSAVTDLLAVLEAALVPAPVGPVMPWHLTPAGGDLDATAGQLRDDASHARAMRGASQAGFTAFALLSGLAALTGLIVIRRGQASVQMADSTLPVERPSGTVGPVETAWLTGTGLSGRLAEALALVAVLFPAASFLANLLPWWRLIVPFVVWLVISLALAAALTALVLALRQKVPWQLLKSPMGAPALASLITVVALVLDPLLGYRLTWAAPLGQAVLNANRVYGFSNTVYVIFASATLLVTVLVAGPAWLRGQRLGAAIPSLAIGLGLVVITAAPSGAANFGGAITAATATLALALVAAEIRLNWQRLVLIGLAGVVAAVAVAWLDFLRGPDRWTHVGAFVQSFLDGDAWPVIDSKVAMWLRMSAGVAVPLLVIALAGWIGAKRGFRVAGWSDLWRQAPMLRPVALATVVFWVVGTLVNDSGLAMVAMGLLFAGPLLVAIVLRHHQLGSKPVC
ncbi:MAG: hypothetical protein FWD29_05840 [Micrococcales bacterium]|nr:hypothetical protein [Micrococcales bacterium]